MSLTYPERDLSPRVHYAGDTRMTTVLVLLFRFRLINSTTRVIPSRTRWKNQPEYLRSSDIVEESVSFANGFIYHMGERDCDEVNDSIRTMRLAAKAPARPHMHNSSRQEH